MEEKLRAEVLRQEIADSKETARFLREARKKGLTVGQVIMVLMSMEFEEYLASMDEPTIH